MRLDLQRALIGAAFAFCLAGAAVAQSTTDGWDALEQGDYVAAIEGLQASADEGDVEAAFQLGALYYEGEGVEQDYAAAAAWYQRAADLGDPDAMFALGLMYSEGQGVPLDYAEAIVRLDLAASLFTDAASRAEALEARDAVSALMAPEPSVETESAADE